MPLKAPRGGLSLLYQCSSEHPPNGTHAHPQTCNMAIGNIDQGNARLLEIGGGGDDIFHQDVEVKERWRVDVCLQIYDLSLAIKMRRWGLRRVWGEAFFIDSSYMSVMFLFTHVLQRYAMCLHDQWRPVQYFHCSTSELPGWEVGEWHGHANICIYNPGRNFQYRSRWNKRVV